MKRRYFLRGAAAALVAGPLASCADDQQAPQADAVTATFGGSPDPLPADAPALQTAAAGRGRYFGTAVQADALDRDDLLRNTVIRDCSSTTPEWAMKWDALAPSSDVYDFSEMDRLAAFAKSHRLKLRGHNLLWHRSVPGWAAARIALNRQWQDVEDHFEKVITRYGEQIGEWDVVNEPIEPNDDARTGLRNNQFMLAFGPDYIDQAFRSAHKFAPHSRKLINEYGLEYDLDYEGQRRLALLRLLERLKSRDVPVDAVGLQAHLDLAKGPLSSSGIRDLLRDVAGMGLQVMVTELDVAEADTTLPLARRDSLVADETRRYLDIVLEFDNVVGLSTWGLGDAYSWLPMQHDLINRGLPYDADWHAKPMHAAIRLALA